MIAVIEIGGTQYTVEKGQMIDVDHQSHDVGAKFDVPALLVADSEGKDVKVGTPTVDGSKVSLKVVEHYKGEKIRVFKIIPKKRHTRTYGFRAMRTTLEVVSIA